MADGLLDTAREVVEAVLSTEGVHSLGTGRYAEAATYEGGEKVSGVVVSPEEAEVHVVFRYPLYRPIPEMVDNIRERVASRVEGLRVSVVVEDLEVAEGESP